MHTWFSKEPQGLIYYPPASCFCRVSSRRMCNTVIVLVNWVYQTTLQNPFLNSTFKYKLNDESIGNSARLGLLIYKEKEEVEDRQKWARFTSIQVKWYFTSTSLIKTTFCLVMQRFTEDHTVIQWLKKKKIWFSKKEKDNPWNERKYLQITYLIWDLHPEYKKNLYSSPIKKQSSLKMSQGFECIFLRRNTNGQ